MTPQTFVQRAAIAAWGDERHVEETRARYRAKRDVLLPALTAAGLEHVGGPGAFFLWCAVPGDGDAEALAARLLEHGIVVAPGTFFGAGRRARADRARSHRRGLRAGGGLARGLRAVGCERARRAARRRWAPASPPSPGSGRVLDTLFPAPKLGAPPVEASPGRSPEIHAHQAATLHAHLLAEAAGHDDLRRVSTTTVLTVIPDLSVPPADAYDAYLLFICSRTDWSRRAS